MGHPRSHRSYLNKSILNAIGVLKALQRSHVPLSTTDVSNAAKIKRDQAYRCLITLEHKGVVVSEGELWRLVAGVAIPTVSRRRRHATN